MTIEELKLTAEEIITLSEAVSIARSRITELKKKAMAGMSEHGEVDYIFGANIAGNQTTLQILLEQKQYDSISIPALVSLTSEYEVLQLAKVTLSDLEKSTIPESKWRQAVAPALKSQSVVVKTYVQPAEI